MKNRTLVTLILVLSVFSCNKDNNDTICCNNLSNCEFETVINPEFYADAPNAFFAIDMLEIEDRCLKLVYSASGCSGDSWVIKFIDSGDVLESNPPQRNLRFSFSNEESCLAYITKETTFDLSNIQVDGNQVLLNIADYDEQILYEY